MEKPASAELPIRSERLPDPAAQVRALLRDPRALAAARAAEARALRLAGIDPEAEPPADIDEFRDALARHIAIYIGVRAKRWRTCKEPRCWRVRSCLAPRNRCSNAPPLPSDPDGRRQARTLAILQRTLRAVQDLAPETGER